jgi:hypothetical protein
MMRFLQEGGWGSWLVLLLSLVALLVAALFAWRPDRRKLAYLQGITVATVFSTLAGLCSNLSATLHYVGDPARDSPEWRFWLTTGLAESLTTGILGFGLLAVVWILAAFGLRRLPPAA